MGKVAEWVKMMLNLTESESECACHMCRNMCSIPCIPTPEEAETLILKGYEGRLMLRVIYIESGLKWKERVGCV
jgi:hypothetical protein